MIDLEKFKGIFPAFPACYDDNGEISPERTQDLVRYCAERGAKGVYITGSSGEFPYQTVDERRLTMKAAKEAGAEAAADKTDDNQ